uniref:Uncharacterized protein n=1 Tax=Dulem virus 61 TaxID=3145772 RepID=A0AAU8BA17_9VIRU
MQRMQIVGFEIIAGVSKKTGNPYDMSKIHTMIPLAQTENARGSVGTSYECPAHVLDKIKNLQTPFFCDVEVQDVQQYGRRVQQIASLSPVIQPKPAQPAVAAK